MYEYEKDVELPIRVSFVRDVGSLETTHKWNKINKNHERLQERSLHAPWSVHHSSQSDNTRAH